MMAQRVDNYHMTHIFLSFKITSKLQKCTYSPVPFPTFLTLPWIFVVLSSVSFSVFIKLSLYTSPKLTHCTPSSALTWYLQT